MKKVQTILNTPKSLSRLSRSPTEAYVKEQVIKGSQPDFGKLGKRPHYTGVVPSESDVTFWVMDPINAELSSCIPWEGRKWSPKLVNVGNKIPFSKVTCGIE